MGDISISLPIALRTGLSHNYYDGIVGNPGVTDGALILHMITELSTTFWCKRFSRLIAGAM